MRSVRGKLYLLSLLLVAATITTVYEAPSANAAQITNRSLQLIAGATDGGSLPGGVVNHKFTFNMVGTPTIGSIKFEYCTVASVVACTAPTGMTGSDGTTNATLGSEAGSAVTGFAMGTRTANSFILTRTAAAVSSNALTVLQANNIKNPTTANYTFFVRITTYSGTDGATGPVDSGTVAASTANPIQLSGVMPESLIFCTGGTISAPGSIPDCSTATSGTIAFNQLFSPTDTAVATSQMAASTNAFSGYAITVNGPLLTSGSSTIPALAPNTPDAPAASVKGVSAFGMNLRANTVASAISFPAGSADVNAAPNGTDLRGQPTANYNTIDNFKYVSGDTIARSDNGGAGPTNAQLFTASYIVNVAGNQLAGTYTTTLTYICTPTF
jgi:hypothetical protein